MQWPCTKLQIQITIIHWKTETVLQSDSTRIIVNRFCTLHIFYIFYKQAAKRNPLTLTHQWSHFVVKHIRRLPKHETMIYIVTTHLQTDWCPLQWDTISSLGTSQWSKDLRQWWQCQRKWPWHRSPWMPVLPSTMLKEKKKLEISFHSWSILS